MFNLFYIFYYAPFFVLDVMVLGFRPISRLRTLHQASMIRFTLNVTFDKIVIYYVINKHLNNCPYSSVFLSANSQSSRERERHFLVSANQRRNELAFKHSHTFWSFATVARLTATIHVILARILMQSFCQEFVISAKTFQHSAKKTGCLRVFYPE